MFIAYVQIAVSDQRQKLQLEADKDHTRGKYWRLVLEERSINGNRLAEIINDSGYVIEKLNGFFQTFDLLLHR